MRRQFAANQRTITGQDNDAVYFRDDASSSSSRENIKLGPFIDFEVSTANHEFKCYCKFSP